MAQPRTLALSLRVYTSLGSMAEGTPDGTLRVTQLLGAILAEGWTWHSLEIYAGDPGSILNARLILERKVYRPKEPLLARLEEAGWSIRFAKEVEVPPPMLD